MIVTLLGLRKFVVIKVGVRAACFPYIIEEERILLFIIITAARLVIPFLLFVFLSVSDLNYLLNKFLFHRGVTMFIELLKVACARNVKASLAGFADLVLQLMVVVGTGVPMTHVHLARIRSLPLILTLFEFFLRVAVGIFVVFQLSFSCLFLLLF